MCDFLTKHRQKSFPSLDFQYSGRRHERDKIEKDHRKRHASFLSCHCIDDFVKCSGGISSATAIDHCGQDSGEPAFSVFDCFRIHPFYLSFCFICHSSFPLHVQKLFFLFSVSRFRILSFIAHVSLQELRYSVSLFRNFFMCHKCRLSIFHPDDLIHLRKQI